MKFISVCLVNNCIRTKPVTESAPWISTCLSFCLIILNKVNAKSAPPTKAVASLRATLSGIGITSGGILEMIFS